MIDIEEKLNIFLKILYKAYPSLSNNLKYSVKFESKPFCDSSLKTIYTYDLMVKFPSQYRDETLSIAEFCGLKFDHEYVDDDTHTFYTGQKEC